MRVPPTRSPNSRQSRICRDPSTPIVSAGPMSPSCARTPRSNPGLYGPCLMPKGQPASCAATSVHKLSIHIGIPRRVGVLGVSRQSQTESQSRKSDLRNHCAIEQPRLHHSLMVTQITLKTEGPHGLRASASLSSHASGVPAIATLILLVTQTLGANVHAGDVVLAACA